MKLTEDSRMITDKSIDGGKPFDWGLTSDEYAKYRNIYPKELFDRLCSLGVAADGTAWLDLGTGTGILPQNLYNPRAEITAVDIAEEQIRCAKEKAYENGWSINYFTSPAESTGLPDNSFDCITASQCFWYFDRDTMKSEISRMIKKNGIFIKIFLDWSFDDELAQSSINLVKKFNPEWNPYSYGEKDIFDDLFANRKTEITDCEIPFTRESWHGRMCACRGTLASMSDDSFAKWSEAHITLLADYPDNFTVRHKLYITYFENIK